MLAKYSIDYIALPRHSQRVLTHHTNDPIEAEEFIMHILGSGALLRAIRHEGVELSQAQSDKMIKVAAERIAAMMVRESLRIDPAELRHRFGLPG